MTYKDAVSLVLDLIENATEANPIVIAIDGRSASGKTTFAKEISQITGVSVIHTDDFCRPRDEKGNLAISQFDGNFDIERFYKEAVCGIKSRKGFEIGIFDCSKGCISHRNKYPKSNCYIVEGAYSHNPKLGDYATLKLFFNVDKIIQQERILKRNGKDALEKYLSVWIPAEERYIEHYNINEKSNHIINN
ncbi:MAG: hypothetical protein E7586_02335 [Ruminococcaceae bacterium]|nr:hypothetical protein [Oscillospiraceae bacterium]